MGNYEDHPPEFALLSPNGFSVDSCVSLRPSARSAVCSLRRFRAACLGAQDVMQEGRSQKVVERSGELAEAAGGHGVGVPLGGDGPGVAGVMDALDGDEAVKAPAELKKLLGWQRRTIARDVISEHEETFETIAEESFPMSQAHQVVSRAPVFPVLLLLTGRESATLHVDQPTTPLRRGDDEVETFE
jgi:hypothetical protein